MKGKKLVLIAVAAVLFLGSAGGGYFLLVRKGGEAKAGEKDAHGAAVKLGEITTNLADPGGRRLIQVDVELRVHDRKVAKRMEEEITGLRDATLRVLRAKTFAEVSGPGAMEALGKEIAQGVNRFLGTPEVQDVFFGRFIVQ